MEYLLFLVTVLLVSGSVGLLIGYLSRRTQGANRTANGAQSKAATDLQGLRHRVGRRAGHATPWGWPGGSRGPERSAHGRPDESLPGALGRWTDTLLTPKRTIDEDPDYRQRAHASVRALVEDRYGRQRRGSRAKVHAGDRGEGEGPSEPLLRQEARVRTPWGW